MKLLFVALLIAVLLGVLAVKSFRSGFSGVIFTAPAAPAEQRPADTGGGSPRKTPVSTATTSNPSGFVGPSGPPSIKGPSGPPPGS